jgi:hypothetical protein
MMLGYVVLDCGTDNVYLEVVVSGETESGFCQPGREAHVTEFFGDFRMFQRQNVSGQSVIEVRNFTVALDFEAAGGDLLWDSGLALKELPHDC